METTAIIHASNSNAQSAPLSKGRLWTARIMIGLPALFLLVDAVGKLVKPAPVVEGTLQLGYPESVILGLGLFCSSAPSFISFRPPPFLARYC
jgi:hypothetical protein